MASGIPTRVRIRRVRTGCWTCRHRGYRCDEAKPSCQTCKRLRLDCEGYGVRLRWVSHQGSELKGQHLAVRRDAKVATEERPSSAEESPEPSRRSIQGPSSGAPLCQLQVTHTPAIPPNFPTLPPCLRGTDVFLVQHFYYTISGLLASTSDRSINTYCHLMLPMALSSPLVLDGVLLLSATHLSSRYDTFQAPSARYRARVLKGLIDRIASAACREEVDVSSLFEITTLATIILLSIAEVFEARSPEDWVKHLGAAGRIIAHRLMRCKYDSMDLDRPTRMILDIFAYHNVLAMIATRGEQPSLYVEEFYAREVKWASLSGRRTAFLASVDTILSIAARLSSLARTSPAVDSQMNGERDLIVRLGEQLRCWSPPEGIEPDTSSTAEAMRQAALILYYELAHAGGEAEYSAQALRSSASLIIEHLRGIDVRSSTVASHVWPLYMAGSILGGRLEVSDSEREENRRFIRDRLVAMRSERGIRSLDAVRLRLEEIWAGPNEREVDDGGTRERIVFLF